MHENCCVTPSPKVVWLFEKLFYLTHQLLKLHSNIEWFWFNVTTKATTFFFSLSRLPPGPRLPVVELLHEGTVPVVPVLWHDALLGSSRASRCGLRRSEKNNMVYIWSASHWIQAGIEPGTFRSRVARSAIWATVLW